MELYTNSSITSEYNLLKCFFLPNPAFEKVQFRFTNNLITALINVVFAPFAVVSNFLILFLLRRYPQLRNPSNILLGCLAFSDLCVGLIVQPSYVIFRLKENEYHFVSCPIRIIYSTSFYVCYGVSFMTLSSISCERYIALKLHLRYKQLVTSRRVYKVVVLIWFVDIGLTALQWAGVNEIVRAIHMGLWSFCLLIACILQYKVYQIVQHHRRQILQQHRHSGGNFHRQTNLTVSLGYIVSVYVFFNIPVLFVTVFHQVARIHLDNYDVYSWTETIAFLNSSLNPLICVWKRKIIRRTLVKLFSNWCCIRIFSVNEETRVCGAYGWHCPSTSNRCLDTISDVKEIGTVSIALSSSKTNYAIENMSQSSVIEVRL